MYWIAMHAVRDNLNPGALMITMQKLQLCKTQHRSPTGDVENCPCHLLIKVLTLFLCKLGSVLASATKKTHTHAHM